jgi:copper(I)-binding protein
MRRGTLWSAAGVGIFIGCGQANSGDVREPVATLGGLSIYDAFAPASAAPDVASVYFTVVNHGSNADSLLSVATAIGDAALHTVVTENGRSRMQPVLAAPVLPGGQLRLRPGGYHVMLTGLAKPVQVGDTVEIALTFARAGTVSVRAAALTYTEVVERLESAGDADR